MATDTGAPVQPPGGDPPIPEERLTRLVRSYIGENWTEQYEDAWRRSNSDRPRGATLSWNWSAAFFNVLWAAYRKQ